jgi:hypothetical protein
VSKSFGCCFLFSKIVLVVDLAHIMHRWIGGIMYVCIFMICMYLSKVEAIVYFVH